ncbi:MAG: ABC transporter ATP-binding protein, partial [Gemmiger sp.]|nr:ABC transporter ATP-binding protein [Gemmiger sp.]
RIADHLRKLPMNFFNEKDLSELTTNMMADCSSMESMLSSTIPPLIANIITVTLTCAMLAFFDWRLALCIFCTMPVAFLIIWLSRNYQKKLFARQVDAKLAASDQVQEYLEGMKIIKSCGLSGARFGALNKTLLTMKKVAVKVEMAVGVFMSSASMILQAGIGIVVFVGTLLLVNGKIELLPLLMFLLMATRIYGPILAVLSQLSSLLNLNVVTERMRTLLTTPAMSGDGKDVPNCDIEMDHVTFHYNTEDVIHSMSCKIPQGSVTALVGPSGSGKSTVSKLIARFWDIQSGTIRVGGKDVRAMAPESLMSYMSFVFQDVTLFNDTVMENIRIGNPNATDAQVVAAAKAAYCDEFVRNMPKGYQTLLGENGNTLSGGERQRISIARALLKDAPIILLDEATASLDPENEVLVQKAIAKLVEGKTVIMIAHRLRTVVDADQILVLENGKLVESGTHEQLMHKNGLYQKLYHIQQESLGWAV